MADDRGSDADAGPSVDVSEAIQFAESFPATEAGGERSESSNFITTSICSIGFEQFI